MSQRSALVLSAAFAALLGGAPLHAGNVWNLTWEDNGNGAANTLPDASKWRHDTGGGGWGNNELQYYTNRVENTRYDGAGNLVIEARAEAYGGRNYTSGRLQTGATFTQAYGRMEARIKLPYGQGIWPAFWMLGNNIGSVGWPTCGEIDIMEMVGYAPNSYFGTLHGPGYSGGGGISAERNTGSNISAGYHEFAVEWEPGIVRWTLDGVHWLTRTPGDIPGGTTWVYDHPHFMILNLAVGGNWPGAPDGSTVFPQQMLIDYVKVYSRDTSQRPYSGTRLPIAGTIQVEDFDDGGPGVAYGDTTTYHPGGVNYYRFSEQPDLAPTNDTGGGYGLGWTLAGEWLEYSVNVATAGNYAFTARVASAGAGGTFHLQMDGVDVANSSMTIPDTGDWGNWQDLGPVTVNLPAGNHVLQLKMDTNGSTGGIGNFNWLRFTSLVTPTRTYTAVPPTALPTQTFSLTRSPTPSVTKTVTLTPPPSATRTATQTATRSATLTSAPSSTFTATKTATASQTRTVTRTPTVAITVTSTPTATSSETAGPSATESPTPPGTLTATPTAPPATASSTATASGTTAPSALPSASATASATATATATASASASVTPSASATRSSTASASPSPEAATATATATPTATLTPSPAHSATRSSTATATPTLSPVNSATRSATPSLSPSPEPVSTSTASPTTASTTVPTAADGGGKPELRPVCNPQRGPQLLFAVFSDGRQRTRLRCYSPAMTAVLDQDLGLLPPGWNRVSLPAQGLPAGLYWARLASEGRALGKPVRVLYLSN